MIKVHNTFFVLSGFINGEEGSLAITTDEVKMKDGWYWELDDGGESSPRGPFESREAADRDAQADDAVKELVAKQIIGSELFGKGGFHCKSTDWAEIGLPIPKRLLSILPVYDSQTLGIQHNPGATFTFKPKSGLFIVQHSGGLYLTSSGGNYARNIRYVGPVEEFADEPSDGPVAEAIDFILNRNREEEGE